LNANKSESNLTKAIPAILLMPKSIPISKIVQPIKNNDDLDAFPSRGQARFLCPRGFEAYTRGHYHAHPTADIIDLITENAYLNLARHDTNQ